MTKYYLVFALCALLALGAAASVSAGASFFGPSGLITMPTAETLGTLRFQAFANYVTRDGSDESCYGLNVGIIRGIELGVTQVHETGASGGNEAIVNAKWTAFAGNLVMPSVVVGAINIANNTNFLGSFIDSPVGKVNPYIVAGKTIGLPGGTGVSLNAGYIAGSVNSAMYGARVSLSPKIELMADYISDFSQLSFGARYRSDSGLGLQLASIDGNFSAGITFTRGLFGK